MDGSNVNIEFTPAEAEWLGHSVTAAVAVAEPMLTEYLQAHKADPADTDAFMALVGATGHFNFLVFMKRKFDDALSSD